MNFKDIQVGEQYFAGRDSLIRSAYLTHNALPKYPHEVIVEVVATGVERTNTSGNDTQDGIEIKVIDPAENQLRMYPVVSPRTLIEPVATRKAREDANESERKQRQIEQHAKIASRLDGISAYNLASFIKEAERAAGEAAGEAIEALDSLIERATKARDRITAGTKTPSYAESKQFENTGFAYMGSRKRMPTESEEGVKVFPTLYSGDIHFYGASEKAAAALGRYALASVQCNQLQFILDAGPEERS